MIYYIWHNSEEPKQFTVGLEAKNFVRENFKEGDLMDLASVDNLKNKNAADVSPDELDGVQYDSAKELCDAIDSLSGHSNDGNNTAGA